MNWGLIGGMLLVIGAILCSVMFLPGMVGSVNETAVPDELTDTYEGIDSFAANLFLLLWVFGLVAAGSLVIIGVSRLL